VIVFNIRAQLGRQDHRVHQGHQGRPDYLDSLVLLDS